MAEDELLDVVDKDNAVIGQDTKENKLKKGFISRNVVVFVMDGKRRFLIPRRAADKRSFPNRYDVAVCGNVMAGESYVDAAKREMLEEIGIACPLTSLGVLFTDFHDRGLRMQYFTAIFLGQRDGEVVLNREYSSMKRLTFPEIEQLIEEDKEFFTPGFVQDWMFAREKLKMVSSSSSDPVVVSVAIISNTKKELLVVRKGKHFLLPGGKIEEGESETDALARELNEELAVEMKKAEKFKTYQFGKALNEDAPLVMHVYLAKIVGEAKAQHEISEVLWLSAERYKQKGDYPRKWWDVIFRDLEKEGLF